MLNRNNIACELSEQIRAVDLPRSPIFLIPFDQPGLQCIDDDANHPRGFLSKAPLGWHGCTPISCGPSARQLARRLAKSWRRLAWLALHPCNGWHRSWQAPVSTYRLVGTGSWQLAKGFQVFCAFFTGPVSPF